MAKKEYITIDATKEDLDYLYDQSALTFEGTVCDEDNLDYIFNEFKEIDAGPKKDFKFYIIKGKLMNEKYQLTGDNRYPNDLTILSIPLDYFENYSVLVTWRIQYDGRWFSDIVDNNSRREKE